MIPLGERALHWVQEYLDKSRPLLAGTSRTAPCSRAGRHGVVADLAIPHVASYVKRAELGKHGGCHLFRHTMATLMLEGGADIRFIQAMLGHAELSTTQIYAQVAIRQLQLVHASTHPGALRRVRGDQMTVDGSTSQPDAENAADALLAALDAEADEEDAC
ncbi:hypothetical protein D3871_25180 [Noviherbaspirillum saxi]|uniref:Tyr recombinase domain-containing protein n=1 Tax=Noviherbaspirillum saxi TaxID=2320863 RepID=A0A3A3FF45_9BURK|nr:hypothetical protein D3871_25180 [Noviherbaspirillum saxi]